MDTYTINPISYESLLNLFVVNANLINVANLVAVNIQDTSLTPNLPVLTDASDNLISGKIDLTSQVQNILPIASGGTNSGTSLNNNRFIISSGSKIVEQSALTGLSIVETDSNGLPISKTMTDNQIIIGKTGSAPAMVLVTSTNGMTLPSASAWSLSTPQDIRTSASPSFLKLALTNATNQILFNTATTTTTINAPSPISGSQIINIVDTGTGSADFVLTNVASGQTINNDLTITGFLTGQYLFSTGVAGAGLNIASITDSTSSSSGSILSNGGIGILKNISIGGLTASMPVKTNASKTLISSAITLPSDITGTLDIAHGGSNSSTALNNNRFIISSGGKIVEQSALTGLSIVETDSNGLPISVSMTDNQIIIGKTGSAPAMVLVTSTNGMTLPSASAWSLSTPQDIRTSASPSFVNLTLTGTTDSSSTSTGTLIVTLGGCGIAKSIFLGGNINVPTTSSTVGQYIINGVYFMHGYGTNNIFIGPAAGNFTMTGTDNTGAGTNSQRQTTTGSYNSSWGSGCLASNKTGSYNTANGYIAGNLLTSGTTNCFYGYNSGANITTGTDNCLVGANSGSNYTSSESNNIILGENSGVKGESGVIRIGVDGTQTTGHISGNITFGRTAVNTEGITLQNDTASYSASLLNYYEEYSALINLTGALVGTTNIQIIRIGKLVTVTLGSASGTSSGAHPINSSGAIPSRMKPTSVIDAWILTTPNNVGGGFIEFDTGGSFQIGYQLTNSNFPASGTVGYGAFTFSYCIN